MSMTLRTAAVTLIAAVALLWNAPHTQAQESDGRFGYRGIGPRVGLSIDPDQFMVGGHVDMGYIARQVRFQPNLELGFGSDITTISINGDFAYRFNTNWDAWSPYAGAGLGINIYDFDGGSQSELGLNLLGGVEKFMANGNRFFVELKLGLADAPDFKAYVGWTFY